MSLNKTGPIIAFFLSVAVSSWAAPEVRLKDIASVGGVRENQLVGIGLVTGLAGRGDSANSQLLKNAVANLVKHFGFDVSAKDVRSRNCAVVTVSAVVPAFMRAGEKIDVTVSSLGDATSLERGVLLQTPLRAANGTVYAVAQGAVDVSHDRAQTKMVGTVTCGAIAERDVASTFAADNVVRILLRNPDFATAAAVQAALAARFPGLSVAVRDSSLIEIAVPEGRRQDTVRFVAEIESVSVTPEPSSKVVIDSRSGVIIMGERVKIGKVAVSYKSANVTVGSYYSPQSDKKEQFVIQDTVTVEDFVKTVRDIGLDTETIIEIMKAIDRAGALYGTLEIK
ncbi:MAG: flagellar basal body P-ring protein FlgI [Spirochaetales bacterium]|nr:flagellar basal body P-ring protein FlgI [Spirochaetales bacterium]